MSCATPPSPLSDDLQCDDVAQGDTATNSNSQESPEPDPSNGTEQALTEENDEFVLQSSTDHKGHPASQDLPTFLARWKRHQKHGRSARCWAFFEPLPGQENTFFCTLCTVDFDNASSNSRKEKKGIIKYKPSAGTSSMKRHLFVHHTHDQKQISAGIDQHEENVNASKSKLMRPQQKKRNVNIRSYFKTHTPYGSNSPHQKHFESDLVLLIAKANLSLKLLESPWFQRFVHGLNPRATVPSRRKLLDKIVPTFIEECMSKFVLPKLTGMCSVHAAHTQLSRVTVTFDLWMSRGCQDIIDIIAHGMDKNFLQCHVHLKLLQCSNTSGDALSIILKDVLQKYNICHSLIAYVQDGGANLKTCTKALKGIAYCEPLDLLRPFEGVCIAHILAGACSKAVSKEIYSDLQVVNFKDMQSTLQKCVTWTKKSGKGREAWYASCRAMDKVERVMPTPVKTRFGSTVTMLSMMVNYKDVVNHCYSNQQSMDLRMRNPSLKTWEIAQVVVDMLEPVVMACTVNQTRDFWLLSDAVASVSNLYSKYRNIVTAMSNVTTESSLGNLSLELEICKKRMAVSMVTSLEKVVSPLLNWHSMVDGQPHHFLSLAVDPEYKTLHKPYMSLHIDDVDKARSIVSMYDERTVLPLLMKISERRTQDLERNDSVPLQTPPSSSPGSLPTDFSKSKKVRLSSDTDEAIPPCFLIDNEEDEGERRYKAMKAELAAFRRDPFFATEQTKFAWLISRRSKYPNVVSLAQHILGIPPTQIENERTFSLAGRIASPLRNNISTETIEKLLCISKNYPNDNACASVRSVDEFSDFLVKREEDEESGSSRSD